MEQFTQPVEGQHDGQETAACKFRIALVESLPTVYASLISMYNQR